MCENKRVTITEIRITALLFNANRFKPMQSALIQSNLIQTLKIQSNDHTFWEGCGATECTTGGVRGRGDSKTFLNMILKIIKGNF